MNWLIAAAITTAQWSYLQGMPQGYPGASMSGQERQSDQYTGQISLVCVEAGLMWMVVTDAVPVSVVADDMDGALLGAIRINPANTNKGRFGLAQIIKMEGENWGVAGWAEDAPNLNDAPGVEITIVADAPNYPKITFSEPMTARDRAVAKSIKSDCMRRQSQRP